MERLRHIREQVGYSQQDLADESGVSQHTISEIELGRRKPQGRTLRKLAKTLGVEVADLRGGSDHPLAKAPPSPTQPPLNGFEEERRTQHLGVWTRYLRQRVEFCEKVLQKSPEDTFNNPFLSLDTAIQWAIYVGIESTQLQDALRTEVRSYTDADSEIVSQLHTLLGRFIAVEDTTDARVKAMMDEAGLTDEDKEQRLRGSVNRRVAYVSRHDGKAVESL